MRTHSPRAFPLGDEPPVGVHHVKGKRRRLARGRQPRARKCLRKGYGCEYQPRCWNQRYCQEPECRWEVRRWQAARRQAKHRQEAEVEARHAQAERERRQRVKAASQAVEHPEVTPTRGHAAEAFFPFPYVIGRAATNRPRPHSATPHATVVPPAVRRFAMSRTGNASGLLAAPWMAGRNGASSTKPRAGSGP